MPKRKSQTPIELDLQNLLLKRGYMDYAIVAIAEDGTRRPLWVAGDGKNLIADRDRIARLHFEMGSLMKDMETFKPKAEGA